MTNCVCGCAPTIKEHLGFFIVGCYSDNHIEEFTWEDLYGKLQLGKDLFPLCGMPKPTVAEAIESWELWQKMFRENEE